MRTSASLTLLMVLGGSLWVSSCVDYLNEDQLGFGCKEPPYRCPGSQVCIKGICVWDSEMPSETEGEDGGSLQDRSLEWEGATSQDVAFEHDHLDGSGDILEDLPDGVGPLDDLPPTVQIDYRSIGVNDGVLYALGNVNLSAGSNVVVFGAGANLPDPSAIGAVGVGDQISIEKIDDSHYETFFILSRDSDTQVTLQSPAEFAHSGAPYRIQRAYQTIQEWESATDGNLVLKRTREIGVCYKDGGFTGFTSINGSITDSNFYRVLTVAEGQRHNGNAGTGVVVDGENAGHSGIFINEDYFVINWLEFKRHRGGAGIAAVGIDGGHSVVLDHLIIYDYADNLYSIHGVHGTKECNFSLRNTMIFNGDTDAVRLSSDSCQAVVQNCTLFNSARGVCENLGTINVLNTISMGHSEKDFDMVTGTQEHNLSSDNTAVGSGSISGKNALDQFISIGPFSENLHIRPTSDAVDAGKDLSSNFKDDIDGEQRGGLWDIGADEFYMINLPVRK